MSCDVSGAAYLIAAGLYILAGVIVWPFFFSLNSNHSSYRRMSYLMFCSGTETPKHMAGVGAATLVRCGADTTQRCSCGSGLAKVGWLIIDFVEVATTYRSTRKRDKAVPQLS